MARTKKEYLFIDGYNITNQWKTLRNYTDSIENSRNKLIEGLIEYKAYRGINVIVVFDAHLVKGSNEKKEIIAGVEVVYTKEHETADSYIEREVTRLGRDEIVQVATSDNAIQEIVIARGGTRLSAEEMFQEISRTKQEIKRKTDSNNNNNTKLANMLDNKTLEKLEKIRRMID
ncbi:NYN domain-containing protein [Sedimentibacter sp. zth1]|uniref:NYN domain-containing protein n=1 Tax=Sedimentibacter sp. zth1 TaxID=2816908 RepID=UPI001A9342C5|nr:NYN domain-containing protein [Sedimentibacter sp. zth1]QSX05968.1 NYN domain-containing protein [Sedimentibacter sp. zth1]